MYIIHMYIHIYLYRYIYKYIYIYIYCLKVWDYSLFPIIYSLMEWPIPLGGGLLPVASSPIPCIPPGPAGGPPLDKPTHHYIQI